MIVLGVICLVIGLVLAIKVLWIIGIVLLGVGLVLAVSGSTYSHPIGGRRHWY